MSIMLRSGVGHIIYSDLFVFLSGLSWVFFYTNSYRRLVGVYIVTNIENVTNCHVLRIRTFLIFPSQKYIRRTTQQGNKVLNCPHRFHRKKNSTKHLHVFCIFLRDTLYEFCKISYCIVYTSSLIKKTSTSLAYLWHIVAFGVTFWAPCLKLLLLTQTF